MSVNACYQCIDPIDLDVLIDEIWNSAWVEPGVIEKRLFPEENSVEAGAPSLQTERNWQGLHSLLSVSKWREQPLLISALLGGTPIGPSLFPGPARYLKQFEVRLISDALKGISEEDLLHSFDPIVMNASSLPPVGGWNKDDFPHLWQTFVLLRDFFANACQSGYAMLLFLG